MRDEWTGVEISKEFDRRSDRQTRGKRAEQSNRSVDSRLLDEQKSCVLISNGQIERQFTRTDVEIRDEMTENKRTSGRTSVERMNAAWVEE